MNDKAKASIAIRTDLLMVKLTLLLGAMSLEQSKEVAASIKSALTGAYYIGMDDPTFHQ